MNTRYLAIANDGDGASYKVFNDLHEAHKYTAGEHLEYGEVLSFTGEVLSIEMSGRGDTVLNGGEGVTVYQRVGYDTVVDTFNLDDMEY